MMRLAFSMKVCSLDVQIAFTVSTGLLTSVCAVASLVSVSAPRIQANLKVFTFAHLQDFSFWTYTRICRLLLLPGPM